LKSLTAGLKNRFILIFHTLNFTALSNLRSAA